MKGRFPLGTLTVDGLLRMGLTNQSRRRELTYEGTARRDRTRPQNYGTNNSTGDCEVLTTT